MLSVADMGRALAFYEGVLGGDKIYQFPPEGDPVFLTLQYGATELGIGLLSGETLHGRPQRPASGHRIELCIDVEDVDACISALRANGAPVALEPVEQPWGERIAYVEDPDGNLVMLAAPAA
jgi:lactoylglutathione lyase